MQRILHIVFVLHVGGIEADQTLFKCRKLSTTTLTEGISKIIKIPDNSIGYHHRL